MSRNLKPANAALVVSILALIAALVGSAIADSGPRATTSAFVPRIVKKAQKKAVAALRKANRALRIARRTSKQQGPKGNTGLQGIQGLPGPQGSPGISGLQVVESVEGNSLAIHEKEPKCPEGKRVIAGGAKITGSATSQAAIHTSAPNGDAAWLGAAHEHTATSENWTLWVYAICAYVE